jgi:hypothetical protein
MSTYNISTLDQLQAISPTHLADDCQLLADIDATATSGWNAGAGFVPINGFTGGFDGNDHTITNLFIYRPSTSGVGLFGGIDSENTYIKGVHLVNVNITGGNNYTGGLVGQLVVDSNIENCSTTGTVTGISNVGGLAGACGVTRNPSVSRCYSECNVTGTSWNVGGLFGYFSGDSSISQCYATGTVTCGSEAGGGLVGYCYSQVSRSYSTGNVIAPYAGRIGGFIGQLTAGDISDCYSTGNVSVGGSGGGFVGMDEGGSITNCYSSGNVVARSVYSTQIGGFVGEQGVCPKTNCFSTGTVTGSNYRGGFAGSGNDDYIVNCGWWTGCGAENAVFNWGDITYNQSLKSAFYDKTHNIYDTGDVTWDFTTPVWWQWTNNLPQLRKYKGQVIMVQ